MLEVPGEKELRAVTEKLTEAGVQVGVMHNMQFIPNKMPCSSDLSAQVVGRTA